MAKREPKVEIDVESDLASDEARIRRARAVGEMAPKTERYQTDPEFRAAVDDLVRAGLLLEASCEEVKKAELELAKAEDAKQDALAELHAARAAQGLAPPALVEADWDPVAQVVRVVVRFAGRELPCALAISPDPASAATFRRLRGTRAVRAFACAPGLWWVRAASIFPDGLSDWCDPVAVLVPTAESSAL